MKDKEYPLPDFFYILSGLMMVACIACIFLMIWVSGLHFNFLAKVLVSNFFGILVITGLHNVLKED